MIEQVTEATLFVISEIDYRAHLSAATVQTMSSIPSGDTPRVSEITARIHHSETTQQRQQTALKK